MCALTREPGVRPITLAVNTMKEALLKLVISLLCNWKFTGPYLMVDN